MFLVVGVLWGTSLVDVHLLGVSRSTVCRLNLCLVCLYLCVFCI